MILEGWRDALWSDRYATLRYDCVSESVANRITRLAKNVGFGIRGPRADHRRADRHPLLRRRDR